MLFLLSFCFLVVKSDNELFEAVENLNDVGVSIETQIRIIRILTKNKTIGGFHANPNVVNYNGQTPLFIAAKQGSLEAVKALI